LPTDSFVQHPVRADRAHEAGADAYLRKSLADRVLIDTLQRLLAERKGAMYRAYVVLDGFHGWRCVDGLVGYTA
jgi:hypothetical protein